MRSRREFLRTIAAAAFAADAGRARADKPWGRAPYRVLYSNDTTNVLGCVSPWHRRGEPFRAELLEASVDEVAGRGVDAHLLQPGLGVVPMWPSKVYPVEAHYRWIEQTYGAKPDAFGRFVLAGGDIVQTFIDRCRLRGQAPFISFRLNDAHHKEHVNARPGEAAARGTAMAINPFYRDHPQFRIGPKLGSASQQVLNWAVPEVRARVFALLEELCTNYDLEGMELDFLRYYSFFRLGETPVAQRRAIMAGFVGEVRALLDRTARRGKRRWLCARVPCFLSAHDRLGIDLPAMVAAGLEMVNVSSNYYTVQQTDLPEILRMVPDATVYLEMCHTTWKGEKQGAGYDTFDFRRTTPEQFQTAAHLAYTRGADGVSLFNFAYYREHGTEARGEFTEPPFDVLPRLADREWLARAPQHYILAPGWNDANLTRPVLPRSVAAGESVEFALDLAPPEGGWRRVGRLRVQTADDWGTADVEAHLNDAQLEPTADVSEPFEHPWRSFLGKPGELRAWTVPAGLLKDGANRLRFQIGKAAQIVVIDLVAS